MRDQQIPPQDSEKSGGYVDINLGIVKNIRKVFLSSNRLSMGSLSPDIPLVGLQLLDVASCAISRLPADFSLKFPNVKVLNLNFNSLTGIEELAGCHCLSRLNVAGNRIARMRKLCQVISQIGKAPKGSYCTLREVDLRQNPLTVGFYAPLATGSGTTTGAEDKIIWKAKTEKNRWNNKINKIGYSTITSTAIEEHYLNNTNGTKNNQAIAWRKDENKGGNSGGGGDNDIVQINDPYTLPLADSQTDKNYLSKLDDSTQLKRRVLELMLYAGSRGSIKVLDGLALRPDSGERGDPDIDRTWAKLGELGVLKHKQGRRALWA